MKNERGLTLVELLAVLAIIGTIMVLLTTVFINGSKASDRNATNQKLQQEANYITETIRKEYLEPKTDLIELKVDNDSQTLSMDGKVISEGYTYCDKNEYDTKENGCNAIIDIGIDRESDEAFLMTLEKDDLLYEIDTWFSKLR